MSAVTVEEVKVHLRITDTANDALLQQKLEAAEDHVACYVGASYDDPPPAVREAILQATAWFYDGTPADLGGLLAPYREWAF